MSPNLDRPRQLRGDRPVIVLDGSEGVEGRALLTISALYWCEDWISRVDVRFSDVKDENVVLAANGLRWDCGISVTILDTSMMRSPLFGADLYGGIAFRSVDHMRLKEASAEGIPALVAVQFPSEKDIGPSLVLRQRAAF